MRIGEILQRDEPLFSYEFFPPRTEEGREQFDQAIAELSQTGPDYASVTYGAGGSTRSGTIDMAVRIEKDFGIAPMAHLSCVGAPRTGVREVIEKIDAAGIDNILALRGDPPAGEGAFVPHPEGFASSVELISYIHAEFPGRFTVGASCFPEIHPEAESAEADIAFLKEKVDAGAGFLITQLFFDNDVFFTWQERVREAGIEVPIIVGLMPIVSYERAVRFCGNCGASFPEALARAMEEQGGNEEAERDLGIAWATRQAEELLGAGVPGIHFYTINRARPTRAILSALRLGRPWERSRAGLGSR